MSMFMSPTTNTSLASCPFSPPFPSARGNPRRSDIPHILPRRKDLLHMRTSEVTERCEEEENSFALLYIYTRTHKEFSKEYDVQSTDAQHFLTREILKSRKHLTLRVPTKTWLTHYSTVVGRDGSEHPLQELESAREKSPFGLSGLCMAREQPEQ